VQGACIKACCTSQGQYPVLTNVHYHFVGRHFQPPLVCRFWGLRNRHGLVILR